MQPYDIVMLVVLVGTVLFGFWKGMAWQIASLASIILSAVVAINFSPQLAPVISETAPWNRIIAMLILYILTALAIWLLFRLVAKVIDRVKLKEFDHQIGALFGLAKGVLWCIIITFFAVTLSENIRQKVLGTYSGRYIAVLIKNATPVLPEEITNVLGEYINELDRKLDPNTPPDPPSDDAATPGINTKEIENQILDGLKEGLDKSSDHLQEGINDKFDELKDAVNDAHKQAMNEADTPPSGGSPATEEAQNSSQGRGGTPWWQ